MKKTEINNNNLNINTLYPNSMNTTKVTTEQNSSKQIKKPKLKEMQENLIIFSIKLEIKGVERKSILWQNLIEKDAGKKEFKFNPEIYYIDDLTFKFSDEKAILDLSLPKHVFDSVNHTSDDNPWKQLKNAILEMLHINITEARISQINFALFESIKGKDFFARNIVLEGFTLKSASERSKKLIRKDKKAEYSLYSYTHSQGMITEEITLKKNHEFLKSYNFSDFMHSYLEDDMIKIIKKYRENLTRSR